MLAVGLVLPPPSSPEPEEQTEIKFDKYAQSFFFYFSTADLANQMQCIKHIGEIPAIFAAAVQKCRRKMSAGRQWITMHTHWDTAVTDASQPGTTKSKTSLPEQLCV